ncbi:MAG: hypothetical protein QF921_13845 [Pseudomonadales bacterium]|nr:hypothetical protein [Pseudomonadales bacterium]MDP6472281.1 hypothetical protein [Pseudomonadales bacterium]MDP6828076.1 hypothetical protein [Pseudomonadales bacterium]MDP6972562.1 hypothetical protein [Pseudomonadales bacterium]
MKEVLLVTKGQPFECEAFFRLFDQMPGVNWTYVEQPAHTTGTSVVGMGEEVSGVVLFMMIGVAAQWYSWAIAFAGAALAGVAVSLVIAKCLLLHSGSGKPYFQGGGHEPIQGNCASTSRGEAMSC